MSGFGVPDDLDLSALIGETINLFCIGPSKVQFIIRFMNDVSIHSYGAGLEVDTGQGLKPWFGNDDPGVDYMPEDFVELPKLLKVKVTTWKVESNIAFYIAFENGVKLRFVVSGEWEDLEILFPRTDTFIPPYIM